MRFRISPLPTSPWAHVVEVVQRKGIGHPDTLCDLLADAVSVGLSRAYVQCFGHVLHHNVADPAAIGTLEPQIDELLHAHLRGAPVLWRDVLAGGVPVC